MRLSLTIPPYDWWCLAAPAARNDEQEESGEQEQSPHPDPPPEGGREIGLRIAGKAGGRLSGTHRLIGTRDGARRRAGGIGRRRAVLRRRPRTERQCQGAARERRAAVLGQDGGQVCRR